ncbi:MAG: hypothetical protein DIU84_02110 [Bacillota bacterium]|nr:MAG: hypothetical protein DIU84_02110 [Bacillota bacterium]
MNRRFHNLVWITVVLALLAAVPASARWAEEAANTTVEIVIDHHEAARSAARLGEDPTRLLARAQEAGAVSAAVREVTLLRLRDQERLILIDGSQASAVLEALAPILPGGPGGGAAVRPGWTYAVLEDGDLARWLLEAWTTYSRAGIIAGEPALHAGQGRYVLAVPEQTPRARVLPLGFYPGDLQQVQAAGLDVIPVVYEPPLRTARMLDLALERWRRLPPARWVLIEQDPAPGFPGVDYPERYADVGAVIRSLEAEVGLLEDWDMLGYQSRGLREVTAAAGARGIRVFTVQPDLLPRLPAAEQIAQHLAAVRERKVRAVHVYPLLPAQDQNGAAPRPEDATAFIAGLKSALEDAGFRVGPAQPFAHRAPAPWTGWVLAVPAALAGSLAAAATLRYLGLWRYRLPSLAAVILPWPALAAAGVLGGQVLLRQAAALLAAMTLPLLTVELAWHALYGGERPAATPAGPAGEAGPVGRASPAAAAAAAAGSVAASLGGGFLAAALLSTPEFLQVWEYFRGVKVSFAVPIAVLALWCAAPALRGAWVEAGPPAAWLRALPRARLSLPQVLGVAVLLAAAALIVWRTASIRDALALELAVRDLLQDLMGVRPRFKEVLLGWPGLAVLILVRPRRPGWLFLFASAGLLVGAGSVINSFAHVFTPVAVSLWRSVNGLLLGIPLGLAAAALLRRLAGGSAAGRMW